MKVLSLSDIRADYHDFLLEKIKIGINQVQKLIQLVKEYQILCICGIMEFS